jgi:UDP-N-acetylglucosamine 2-epimerase
LKIITVLGARPQFIKAALVSRELRKNHNEIIIHTGQHYNHELSDIFFGVYLTGDVMLDCFLHFSKEAEKQTEILDDLGIEQGNYLLATVHRASNTDTEEKLREICKAFIELAQEIELVFPVHPRTEKYLKQYGLYQVLKDTPNIHLIKPVGYLEMLVLTKNAGKILTDSGGLQKEAYFAKVPCITLDTVSAWPETVEDGWNMVVGEQGISTPINLNSIIQTAQSFIPKEKQHNMFGDGRAVEDICEVLDSSINYNHSNLLHNAEKI